MRGAPGGKDEEHSVVGELGEGEESEDSEVDEQGEGGDVEQQVGEPGQAPQAPGCELLELDARCEELEKLNCRWLVTLSIPRLVAVSQDSAVVHERFASINRGFGGAFGIKFPLMEDKGGKISKLYGVDKAGAGHSFRAYFIVDPGQTVRARVVGDLPVALGIGEMVRQVRALQLAVINNIFVDSKGNKLGACPAAPDTAEQDTSKGFLTTSASFYNTKILGKSGGHLQSPVNLPAGTPDPTLGPVSFHYTAVWDTHPELRGPGALSTTELCSLFTDLCSLFTELCRLFTELCSLFTDLCRLLTEL